MKITITHLFDSSGLSLNGRVQLDMEEAHHNCHGTAECVGYEQRTTIYLRDNGTGPVTIVSANDECDNQIDITGFWAIDHDDDHDDVDWGRFEVIVPNQGYDLDAIFGH